MGRLPSISWTRAVAAPVAPSTAMAVRPWKRWSTSSSTNTAPPSGAPKAEARPAAAPPEMRTRPSSGEKPKRRARFPPRFAPIETLGPSRPSARPAPIAASPPRNVTTSTRSSPSLVPNRTADSTCGMPLPVAAGARRCTPARAAAVASAAAATGTSQPQTGKRCDHRSRLSRARLDPVQRQPERCAHQSGDEAHASDAIASATSPARPRPSRSGPASTPGADEGAGRWLPGRSAASGGDIQAS